VGGLPYLRFVAPGLLAAHVMQVATAEALFMAASGLRYSRVYHAMLATPLRVREILLGHVLAIGLRAQAYALVFAGLGVLMGAFSLGRAPLIGVVGGVTGLCCAAPVLGFTARFERDWAASTLERFFLLPMFLLAGVFYDVDRLPVVLRFGAWATPLWHGVEVGRWVNGAPIGWMANLGHLAALGAWLTAGLAWAGLEYRRKLRP
jgi:lipooligosaccharide transport system permease protein